MAEIIKVYKEHQPKLRFIGKCYSNEDRDEHGSYGGKWGEWFQNGWFSELEKLGEAKDIENGYLGLMGCSEKENSFQYWIGILFPWNTPVPDGYQYVDMPESDIGICWIYGNEQGDNIYGMHNACIDKLKENGMSNYREDFNGDGTKWWWFFERYNCPRFTSPDDHGKVILDYGMYLA